MTRPFESTLTRRALLARGAAAGLSALGLLLPPRSAAAKVRPAKINKIERGERGWTLWLEMQHGPFPHEGSRYKDATTVVFVPEYFRPTRGKLDAVIHFHGHGTTARDALDRYVLREQLYDSGQDAILIVPQGPVRASDSSGGKLDERGGLLRFLTEIRKTLQTDRVRRAVGKSKFPGGARIGKLCLSAHSGGFRVAARCLKHGRWEISEVYLFDALYADHDIFRDWLLRGKKRKLVSFYVRAAPARLNRKLMDELRQRRVKVVLEEHEGEITRTQLTKSRAVFIHTDAGHGGAVFRHNGLRDCLFASQLTRHVKRDWFKHKHEPRPIDVRKRR